MSVSQAGSTLELLQKEVARILNTETADTTIPLAELGVDSLNVVELLLFCDQLYGSVDMDRLEIGQFTTLESLDEQLRREAERSSAATVAA
jgi:acyl carrier protein